MIFDVTDVIPELYDEFPELTHESIDKIGKAGISAILKLMKREEEINIKISKLKKIKFYFPTTPEKQSALTTLNIRRRKKRAERLQNGEASK